MAFDGIHEFEGLWGSPGIGSVFGWGARSSGFVPSSVAAVRARRVYYRAPEGTVRTALTGSIGGAEPRYRVKGDRVLPLSALQDAEGEFGTAWCEDAFGPRDTWQRVA